MLAGEGYTHGGSAQRVGLEYSQSCESCVTHKPMLHTVPLSRFQKEQILRNAGVAVQKRLRLLRARWLLLFEPRNAASIAFAVGYESASQFSREYARLFGMPPARDMARFKAPAVAQRPTAVVAPG